jgi:calcium/calmodulin-dependent protein kinase (CaM kinase) II
MNIFSGKPQESGLHKTPMLDSTETELLALNQRLLDCIANRDWASYVDLCDPTLTAFEPEAAGHLVEGMSFHRFYFNLKTPKSAHRTTMVSPHVRLLGSVAVVAYTRLVQTLDAEGKPKTEALNETRVWHKQNGAWKHVHFHRSAL